MTRRDWLETATRLALVAVFFGIWELGVRLGRFDPFYFSSPSAVVRELWTLLLEGKILRHTLVTLEETLLGFGLGSAAGLVLALALNASPFWARVLDPIIALLYGIPRIALAPLFVLWFGLGMASKVIFAFMLVFFLVFYNAYAGLKAVSPGMFNAARVMGATRWQLLRKVTLPAISPWLMAGLKSGMGMSLLGAIIGEYVGGNAGLGWLVNSSAGLFRTDRVFAALLVLGLMVLAMNAVLNWLEKRQLRWMDRGKHSTS